MIPSSITEEAIVTSSKSAATSSVSNSLFEGFSYSPNLSYERDEGGRRTE